VVDELLAHGADPNQALTHGLNNALCVAMSPLGETNRSPPTRIALVRTYHALSSGVAWFTVVTLRLVNHCTGCEVCQTALTTVTVECGDLYENFQQYFF